LKEDDLIVTIRPPATEAHYHNPESVILFEEVINSLGTHSGTKMIILPRNERKQTEWIKKKWRGLLESGKIIIPEHVVDGLNLIWHSDLVISGGGTMNREAAALGVPVYSIFRGTIGAVDRHLSETGRLILLETVEDVRLKINLQKRPKRKDAEFSDVAALNKIVEEIIDCLENPSN
jgi:predicted glycosyltransferase